MTAPRYPYFPPQQPPLLPPARLLPPPKRHSTIDVVVTVIMCTLTFGAASLSFVFSLFFAMATDGCSTSCNTAPLTWAYLVTWGGIGVATIATIVGIAVAAGRGRTMWIWPTLSLVLIVAATIVGLLLANSFMAHH